jgi:hypothetical protein
MSVVSIATTKTMETSKYSTVLKHTFLAAWEYPVKFWAGLVITFMEHWQSSVSLSLLFTSKLRKIPL